VVLKGSPIVPVIQNADADISSLINGFPHLAHGNGVRFRALQKSTISSQDTSDGISCQF
jgi:hypothetical protein